VACQGYRPASIRSLEPGETALPTVPTGILRLRSAMQAVFLCFWKNRGTTDVKYSFFTVLMNADAERVRDAWNDLARRAGLPKIRLMNTKRLVQLNARLKESDLASVLEAIDAVGESPFCLGDNKHRWQASLDFVLQPSSFVKLLEGAYRPKRDKFRNGALEILAREAEESRRHVIVLEANAISECQGISLLGD
jgi:hypothetical protein